MVAFEELRFQLSFSFAHYNWRWPHWMSFSLSWRWPHWRVHRMNQQKQDFMWKPAFTDPPSPLIQPAHVELHMAHGVAAFGGHGGRTCMSFAQLMPRWRFHVTSADKPACWKGWHVSKYTKGQVWFLFFVFFSFFFFDQMTMLAQSSNYRQYRYLIFLLPRLILVLFEGVHLYSHSSIWYMYTFEYP